MTNSVVNIPRVEDLCWFKYDEVKPKESKEYLVVLIHKHNDKFIKKMVLKYHVVGNTGTFEAGTWFNVVAWMEIPEYL